MQPRILLPAAVSVAVLLAGCSDSDRSAESATADGPTPEVEWPVFGYDPGNTRYNPDERTIGVDEVGDLEMRWQADGMVGVTSTPTVVDDTVYVGDYAGHVSALATTTGDEMWSTDLDAGVVYGSPAVTDDMVFAGDQAGFLHGMRRETGELVWSVRAGDHPSTIIFNSPVLADDLVVVGVGSIENYTAPEDFTFRGSLSAYDQSTGEERWRVFTTPDDDTSGAGAAVWSTPAVDEERKMVFAGTGQHYEPPAGPTSDSVIAVDYERGELVWSHQFTEGDVRTFGGTEGDGPDADVGAGPNLFSVDDRDLVGAGDKAGKYKALDRDTGDEVWTTDLTVGGLLGGVEATGAVAEGVIYVGSNVGDESTGAPTGVSSLFALDAASGEILWDVELQGSLFGSPTVANGVVYQGTQLRTLHAFDAEDGDELWSHETDGDVGGGPSVVEGVVYWGYGFFLFDRPDDPKGGVLAFALPD